MHPLLSQIATIGISTAVGAGAVSLAWRHAYRQMAQRATHDPLTGLLNRGGFYDHLAAHPPMWVAVVDVDNLTGLNTLYGHPGADVILATLAARLDTAARAAGGVAGRLGGDEFAVALPTHTVVSLLLDAGCTPVPVLGRPVQVSVSIGVACHEPAHPDLGLGRADRALYRAKDQGRARLCVYDPDLDGPCRTPLPRPARRTRPRG